MEKNKVWQESDYKEYLNELESKENPKYRDFHSRLTTTKYPILGINVPECRRIAKRISKTNPLSFLKLTTDTYYEEVLIEGFVIAELEEENFFPWFCQFLPKIDNWAICDGFCNSIKILSNKKEMYFDYFLNLLEKEEPFTIRVGLVTLLSFYIEEQYLSRIYQKIDQIKSDYYYANMGIAWLLAEMYTKYPTHTEEYLKISKINDFTMNKTISKIRDSYRITKEQKDDLLKYKRRNKK